MKVAQYENTDYEPFLPPTRASLLPMSRFILIGLIFTIISQGKTLDEPYGSLTRANPKGGRDSLRERSLTSSLQNLSHSSNGISQTWSLLELVAYESGRKESFDHPVYIFIVTSLY